MVQQAETGRQATILGAQYGQSAGANANYQQALLNQANANRYANQMQNEAITQGLQTLATTDFSSLGDGSLPQGHYDDATQTTYDPNKIYK